MTSSKRWWWSFICLLLASVVTVLPSRHLVGLRGSVWQALAAASDQITSTTNEGRSLLDVIRSIRTLREKNQHLEDENIRLQGELLQLKEVDHENSLLRQELGFVEHQRNRFTFIPGQVIGRPPTTFFQSIVINVGTADGVTAGDTVVAQGYFIGRISQTNSVTATVELITASRSRIPISLSESRATGLMRGGLAGLEGEDFPADVTLTPGEGIVTSSLGDVLPPGLPVGSLGERISAESDIIQKASINSPIEFGKIESVLILKMK